MLGACSSDHGDGAGHGSEAVVDVPDDATFNAADVAFAQEMILHHGQAVTMADLALAASTDAEVLALAEQIKAAQDPEISTMTGWLATWGYEAPDPAAGAEHGGDTMADMAMPGMMTDEEMASLEAATGLAFDRLFLELMIRHHEGAIEMSEQVQADGEDPAVEDLAAAIITAQQAEIEAMRAMLAARPPT